MFMISKLVYQAVFKPGLLAIEPYEDANHLSNFYYFRLGAEARGEDVVPIKGDITIPKQGFVHVWSMERFTLSDRVLALFGDSTSFVKKGLNLVHGLSVDPGFNGSLLLGIRNNGLAPVVIRPGEIIGKIIFYDVSDSMLNVEEFLKSALTQEKLKQRDEAAEKILELYADLKKPK
jgi:deoxycytidine triphosphate deaminase